MALEGINAKLTNAKVLDIVKRFSWSELDPVVSDLKLRRILARERVARGEDLRDAGITAHNDEPPMHLESWEPATYWKPPEHIVWPTMNVVERAQLPAAGLDIGPDPVLPMLEQLASRLDHRESIRVQGTALEAMAGLGLAAVYVAELSLADMLAHVAYIASSGPRGETRLTDTGRKFGWRLLAAVAQALALTTTETRSSSLQRAGERVRWISFDTTPESDEADGWDDTARLAFAIEDPEQNIAWTMAAQGPPDW